MTRKYRTKTTSVCALWKYIPLFTFVLCGCPKAAAQTPVTLSSYSRQQFFDASGRPLAGGKVCTYQAGTSTPLATYTDNSGTSQNTNPVILDAGGYGSLWLSANAYKFTLRMAGSDLTCNTGTQQWVIDNVTPPPFAAGNNSWTGNETHAGTEVFNAAVTLNSGGAMSGAFTGSPTFSGNPTFSGAPIFSNLQNFPTGISTDIINGTLTNGGNMVVTAANGAAATAGEGFILSAGNGGTGTSNGGSILQTSGNGGSAGGVGGNYSIVAGNSSSGNSSGGAFAGAGGQGTGTSPGGNASIVGGGGGSTAGGGGIATVQGGVGGVGGGGGDVKLAPGAGGAGGANGSLLLLQSGRLKFQVAATGIGPVCLATGIGATGTCVLANYSTDTSGTITMTPAAGVAALGAVIMTFSQSMGVNGSLCMYTLQNTPTGTWNARATAIGQADNASTSQVNWDNNAVALTAASQYNIKYFCRGEN